MLFLKYIYLRLFLAGNTVDMTIYCVVREGTFLIGGWGGGVVRGILEIFCEKSRGPPDWINAWPFTNT